MANVHCGKLITYAIRGQKVLERYGIQSHMNAMPVLQGAMVWLWLRVRGNAATAQAALIQSGIKVLDILEDGRMAMRYFDNSATTFPKPKTVVRAVEQAMRLYGANPGRSGHDLSLRRRFRCMIAVRL
jgi:hypothetical protein